MITKRGVLNGRYTWQITMPILVTYQNKDTNIAYLPQELHFNSDFSLKEFVVGNNSELIELDKRIDKINNMLSKVESDKKQFELLDELEEIQFKKDKINILNLEINAGITCAVSLLNLSSGPYIFGRIR